MTRGAPSSISLISQAVLLLCCILFFNLEANAIEWYLRSPSIGNIKNNRYRESLPYYVSTVGFRMIADSIFDDPSIHPGGYDSRFENTLARIKSSVNHIQDRHPIIYVNPRKLSEFLVDMAPKISQSYILILHNDDYSVPDDYSLMNKNERVRVDMNRLLADKNIKHFFISNYVGLPQHNITAIPLGVDFHASVSRPGYLGIKVGQSPYEQSEQLRVMGMQSPNTVLRSRKVLMNSHFSNTSKRHRTRGLLDRHQIAEILRKNPLVVFQEKKLSRHDTWKLATKYAFVYSPVGNGFDCHRVWESLALGQIVLVQSSPLDHLFKGLPVVPIKDLNEINEKNLTRWLSKFGDIRKNSLYQNPLTFKYWEDKILEQAKLTTASKSNSNILKRIQKFFDNDGFITLGSATVRFK